MNVSNLKSCTGGMGNMFLSDKKTYNPPASQSKIQSILTPQEFPVVHCIAQMVKGQCSMQSTEVFLLSPVGTGLGPKCIMENTCLPLKHQVIASVVGSIPGLVTSSCSKSYVGGIVTLWEPWGGPQKIWVLQLAVLLGDFVFDKSFYLSVFRFPHL